MAWTEIGTRQVIPEMEWSREGRYIITSTVRFTASPEVIAAAERAMSGGRQWPIFRLTLTMEVPDGTD